jgi:REP element-mobilizing transposase RayT
MSHSYVSNRIHLVFSTRDRKDLISDEAQPKLWAYIAGIGKNISAHVLAVGGTANHTHILLALPPTLTLASTVQKIKGSSSKWMNDSREKSFRWQEGYGAFSISVSNVDAVIRYIDGQSEHHRKHTFEDEFRSLLLRHGIKFDERFVFG